MENGVPSNEELLKETNSLNTFSISKTINNLIFEVKTVVSEFLNRSPAYY